MEVVRAKSLEIAYERVGEGPPIVFVHGATVDSRMWQPQLAGLADEFTVVAWDEPGAGRSSDVPASFVLADYADCLAALIDALGLGPAHVAGLSWGGSVAQELYRHHPELVATLILADTYAGWKGSLPEEEVRARVEGVRQMLAAADHVFDPTLPGLFAGEPPLIWGELDARSPLSVARQLEQAIPDTKLVVIPGAGHVSNLEQPQAFNDAIREFCRNHPPRPG